VSAQDAAVRRAPNVVFGVNVGLISVLRGDTTLPVWSYVVALISGTIITPFSTLLYARMGNGIATNQLLQDDRWSDQSRKASRESLCGYLDSTPYYLTLGLFLVLHVESRCSIDLYWASWRPQIRTVPQSMYVYTWGIVAEMFTASG
jgi:hypothetical protein